MRYCVGCTHFVFNHGEEGYSYSTLTQDPGSDAEICCAKNHWEVKINETTRQEFSEFMETADKCHDFDERPAP